MTSQEIANWIRERFDSIHQLEAGVKGGKLYTVAKTPNFFYDISNEQPKIGVFNFDWFKLTKEEIIEVIGMAENRDAADVEKMVNEYIDQEKVDDSKKMYLIPFAK